MAEVGGPWRPGVQDGCHASRLVRVRSRLMGRFRATIWTWPASSRGKNRAFAVADWTRGVRPPGSGLRLRLGEGTPR